MSGFYNSPSPEVISIRWNCASLHTIHMHTKRGEEIVGEASLKDLPKMFSASWLQYSTVTYRSRRSLIDFFVSTWSRRLRSIKLGLYDRPVVMCACMMYLPPPPRQCLAPI